MHGDFTTIQEGEYRPIDVLVGGTPCQAFSVAGLRKGLADDRGNLALEYIRLAERLRPRWLVWENVPGVISSLSEDEQIRAFGCFLAGLRELGYDVSYRILNAQWTGLAQRRKRVFVVGYFGDWRCAGPVLLERASLCGYSAPSRGARKAVAAPLASSATSYGGYRNCADTTENLVAPDIASTLTRGAESGGKGGYAGRRQEDDSNLVAIISLEDDLAFALRKSGGGSPERFDMNVVLEPAKPMTLNQADKRFGAVTAEDLAMSLTGSSGNMSVMPGDPTTDVAQALLAKANSSHRADAETYVAVDNPTAYRTNAAGQVDAQGDVTAALTSMTDPCSQIVAFAQRQGEDVQVLGDVADVMSTKPGMHQQTFIMEEARKDLAHALRGEGHDGSEDGTGRGVPLIAEGVISGAVTRKWDHSGGPSGDECYNLVAARAMRVRRLLPEECAKLMGFPIDFLDIEFNGKPAADSLKYKALGNSMATPVMAWIGRRIQEVEDFLASLPEGSRPPLALFEWDIARHERKKRMERSNIHIGTLFSENEDAQ